MKYVNGELVQDDDTQDQSGGNFGLSAGTNPNRTSPDLTGYTAPTLNTGPSQQAISDFVKNRSPVTEYLSELPTSTRFGGDLTGNANARLNAYGSKYGIDQSDWLYSLNSAIANTPNGMQDLDNWGPEMYLKQVMTSLKNSGDPRGSLAYNDYLGTYNPNAESSQQAGVKSANDALAASHHGGGDFFSALLPALLIGGLGAATGGFGLFGAGAGAGSTAGLASGGMSFAPEAFSSAFIPNASVAPTALGSSFGSTFGAGAAAGGAAGLDSMLNDIGVSPGSVDFGSQAMTGNPLQGLSDLFGNVGSAVTDNPVRLSDVYSYTPSSADPGAETFFGNGQSSVTNLEQALNTPNLGISQNPVMPDVPTIADNPMGFNPETVTSADQVAQAGLDSPAPIVDKSVQAGIGDQARLGFRGIKDMFNSPMFQIAQKLNDMYGKSQKQSALQDLFGQMKGMSDPNAQFRDLLMKSYTDPNFFASMPEFKAGMGAFQNQYAANAAKNGTRGQLGGAANQIAVNQEAARLSDLYRSRLAGPASVRPDTSGMATVGTALANQKGNMFNSLLDPALWKALGAFA